MILTLLAVVTLCAAADASPGTTAGEDKLDLGTVAQNAAEVPRYGLFELRLSPKATFDNPFNPDDLDVHADFTPPEGTSMRVNGFYTQDCVRKVEEKNESFSVTGEPYWAIRFSPNAEGTWRYTVSARDRSGTVRSAEATFLVTPANSAGFIRRNPRAPNLFMTENGAPFLAIGENMCWGSVTDYEKWLPALGNAGGNWIRLWVFRWNCGLEWTAEDQRPWDSGQFGGLGIYNLCNAAKLDMILDEAARQGVNVMLCLGTYGEFTTGGFFHEGMWDTNPYNAVNGGPCAKPEDFWTDPKARALYKQRLHYMAARYGWRTNVFAWEFWNEAYPPAGWVQEMAQFLKGDGNRPAADPFGHLVSTSYGKPEIWNLPEVDFTMTHHYGEANVADHTPVVMADARQNRSFGKPHLMAEFGLDWRSSDDKQDPQFYGINLHNGLWSSVFGGNAGTSMIWYWDSYVHPGNLYCQFSPLRKFTDRVPWQNGPWSLLDAEPAHSDATPETWRDLAIAPAMTWGKASTTDFVITPLGGSGNAPLPGFLYGPYKPDLRVPLVFKVNYDHSDRFALRVNSVSSKATFQIAVDGKVLRETALSAVPPEDKSVQPEYESTELLPEYNSYRATFNKVYDVEVPAGEHTITVDVTDGDWLSVAEFVFAGYVSNRYPKLNTCGITNGTVALLWAQNAEHNWRNVRDNIPVSPIPNCTTVVRGLADGDYACIWYDTWTGTDIRQDTAKCAAGALTLTIPPIEKDLAVIMQPVAAPAQ